MRAESIKFRGHGCFKEHWAGFDTVKKINVIIGRNNTGKSHLLDLIEAVCSDKLEGRNWQYQLGGFLRDQDLLQQFGRQTTGGDLGGTHWEHHGSQFVDVWVDWDFDATLEPSAIRFPDGFSTSSPFGDPSTQARLRRIQLILKAGRHWLRGKTFCKLAAERRIGPETGNTHLALGTDGHGATNIIRRYLLTSNENYPSRLIQKELLEALNEVFGLDGKFNEIRARTHDEPNAGQSENHWEVYLGEEGKGLVPLSRSGSGLQTIILVLLNLLIVPEILRKKKAQCVFAFEELENNLHPSLFRRLLQYLENYAEKEDATIFLTTHSSVALDVFAFSKNAQIIRVSHDRKSARTALAGTHFEMLSLVADLGAKPSDLLQANGIIWVEGPSDRIYLNRWIQIFGDGKWREGRDYQCAFYGGALLSHAQAAAPNECNGELVNLLQINPNIIVVADGDRTAKVGTGADLKPHVARLKGEVERIPGAYLWITEAKEIENYLTGSVLGQVYSQQGIPDPGLFQRFFPSKEGRSFVEANLKRKTVDKVDLALKAAPHFDRSNLATRFDLPTHLTKIVDTIAAWNK